MRILQIIPVFADRFGGPVTVVRSISKKLSERHEVDVYTTCAVDNNRDSSRSSFVITGDGFRTFYFPRILAFTRFNISVAMSEALRRNISSYDVIHLHAWRHFQDTIVSYHASRQGVPYILQPHGSMPRVMSLQIRKLLFDELVGRSILNNASKVIALSKEEARDYRTLGLDSKIEIIPNGIDLTDYSDLPPMGLFRRRAHIPREVTLLLYLGRLNRIKGLDVLLAAFAEIAQQEKNVFLAVCGPDDGYAGELDELIRSLGLGYKVSRVGPLYGRDKLEAYVDADVFVLPSLYETFPMSVLEAYACSKPVIASDVGGLRELVVDRETGLLTPAGDVQALAGAGLELIRNRQLAGEMGRRGRSAVENRFNLHSVVSSLSHLYESVQK